MLETLWYMLILVLQVLQANPQLQTEKMQIDVLVSSKNAYSFIVKGTAVQGQIVNAESHSVFGEFESTRRVPQAYVIFPRMALPAELEAAARGNQDQGSSALPAKTGKVSKTADSAGLPATFTIDYTKVLKQLRPFSSKPRQSIEYPEMERFLGGGQDGKSASKPKSTPVAAIKSAAPAAATTATATSSPNLANKSADQEKASLIELQQYANRLVLTADFAQLVIIVNFM